MKEQEFCPECYKHCSKDALACGRGRRYFKETVVEDQASESIRRHHHGRKHHCPDETMDSDEKLQMMLRRCGRILGHRSGEKSSQERILYILAKKGKIAQKALLEELDVKAGSLSEILGKLEQSELIIRTQNESDKRNVDIMLSEHGKAVVMERKGKRKQKNKDMFTCFDENEKEQLIQLLETLFHSWKQQHHVLHHHHGKSHNEKT